ncbi:MAG: hypothetical protein ACR2H2_15270 [Solirubrobacteraceae bacterium]
MRATVPPLRLAAGDITQLRAQLAVLGRRREPLVTLSGTVLAVQPADPRSLNFRRSTSMSTA